MKIVGYADRLSVQPGQSIRFMVSSELPAYRAKIVRLIHGDANPKGPGVKVEPVPQLISGQYGGRTQEFLRGSYVIVPDVLVTDNSALDCRNGFTLLAWIYATTPRKGVQGILTRWSESDQAGYGLFIDGDHGLGLWIGDGQGTVERVQASKALTASQWYFVAGTYDSQSGKVRLHQEPLTQWPLDPSAAVVEAAVKHRGMVAS